MLIAKEKEKKNIVEYILYMWQMEDLVRGNEMNLNKVLEKIFPGDADEKQKVEYTTWFSDLIQEMIQDGLFKTGHIKGVKTYMKSLDNLHHSLVTIYQDQKYIEIHNRSAAYIKDLRDKSGQHTIAETEICLIGLYGFLMLKMSGAEISEETVKAMKEISAMMAHLADSFNKLKKGELKLPSRMSN